MVEWEWEIVQWASKFSNFRIVTFLDMVVKVILWSQNIYLEKKPYEIMQILVDYNPLNNFYPSHI